MKAAILEKPFQLKLVDIPKPEPADDEVLLKIKWVGICASDVEIYSGVRSPESLLDPSRIGHEPASIIEKVGKNVTGLKKGDHVISRLVWGCFAEYVVAKAIQVKRIPERLPLIEGTAVEVLPPILYAVERAKVDYRKDVLIMGQGVQGLLLTQIVRLYNPHTLVTTDLFDEKLELSTRFGATHAINASKENVNEKIKSILPHGPDVVILALVKGDRVQDGIDVVGKGGKIILYGCVGPAKNIDFYKLHLKRADIFTTTPNWMEERRYYEMAVNYLMEGIINTKALVTHKFSLLEISEAFKLKEKPRGDVIHVMIDCTLE